MNVRKSCAKVSHLQGIKICGLSPNWFIDDQNPRVPGVKESSEISDDCKAMKQREHQTISSIQSSSQKYVPFHADETLVQSDETVIPAKAGHVVPLFKPLGATISAIQ
jgi:hypothetical protein